MPDFSRYSNYKPETSFSSVVFGARAPVLEVELNELQQILNTKLQRLASFFGNTIIPDTGGGIVFSPDTQGLSVTRCSVIAGALTAYIPQASVILTEVEPVAYIKMTERVITFEDPIRVYGVQNNEDFADNTLIDSRIGVETSRRKVVEVTLIKGATLPETSTTDVLQYVPLGTMKNTAEGYVFEEFVGSGSLGDILNKLNQQQTITTRYEDGVLYLDISNTGGVSSNGGTVATPAPVVIPLASRTTAGLVKIGDGINIASDGTISSSIETMSDVVADTAAEKVIDQMDDIDDSEIDAMFK